MLVENHSLKPYRQRVLGTYVLLEEALRALGARRRRAAGRDRARTARCRPGQVLLALEAARGSRSGSVAFLPHRARDLPLRPPRAGEEVRWTGPPAAADRGPGLRREPGVGADAAARLLGPGDQARGDRAAARCTASRWRR